MIVDIIHIVLDVEAYIEVAQYIQFLCFPCHDLFIMMLFLICTWEHIGLYTYPWRYNP